jgi:hypothetical protein
MAGHAENEASLRPIATREEHLAAIKCVVARIGGPAKTALLIGRTPQAVWLYERGKNAMPSRIAGQLAAVASDMAQEQTALTHALRRLERDVLAYEAEKRAANRERYFQRFGRYPVPARGNKTP